MQKDKKERTKLGPFQTVFKGVIFEIQQAEATLATEQKKSLSMSFGQPA